MHVLERTPPSARPLLFLAAATSMIGVGGMAISFLYLAAAGPLDVLAGAAGFIAGAILAGAGLLASALLAPAPAPFPACSPPLVDRWLAHFHRNRANRPEPDWRAPMTLPAEVVRPLVRSLEQFQLGDGGGPACLIAWDAERFRSSSAGTRALVDLWFAEEREHARLLGRAVARFGGRRIRSHWSFTIFCQVRRWLGVRFELTVLLLTEIVSTAYYRLLWRHGRDPALRAMCRLILRDEAGHIAFHRQRLAQLDGTSYGPLWELRFRALGLAAATMLWVNHAAGLQALGASGTEFYREVSVELSRFVRRLRTSAWGTSPS